MTAEGTLIEEFSMYSHDQQALLDEQPELIGPVVCWNPSLVVWRCPGGAGYNVADGARDHVRHR